MKLPVDEKESAELPEEETKSSVQCAVSKMYALLQSAKKRGFEIMEQEALGGLACTSVGDGMTSWEHEGKPRPSKRGRDYKDPVLGVMYSHAVLPGMRQKIDETWSPDRSRYQGNKRPKKPRSKNAAANNAIIALMQRVKGEVQTCNQPTCSAKKRDGKPALATAQWRTDDRWCRECWVRASGSSTHRLLRESMQVH